MIFLKSSTPVDREGNRCTNVILTGIGGQGIVFASQLLRKAVGGRYGNVTGFDVRGGAQRYGHVAAVVRFTRGPAFPPIQPGMDIPPGGADFIVSLEASEGLRFIDRMSRQTTVILDRFTVIPTNVRRSGGFYPGFSEAVSQYRRRAGEVAALDLRKTARACSDKAVDANLLALGAFCAYSKGLLDPDDFSWAASSREMELIKTGFAMSGVTE